MEAPQDLGRSFIPDQTVEEIKLAKRPHIFLREIPLYMAEDIFDWLAKSLGKRTNFYRFADYYNYEVWQDKLSFKGGGDGKVQKLMKLQDGDSLNASLFAELGYTKVNRVWNVGEFSVLGDVVVVWLEGWHDPVRISLFGEEIENIAMVDKNSRRTISELNEVLVTRFIGSSEQAKGAQSGVHSYVGNPEASDIYEKVFVVLEDHSKQEIYAPESTVVKMGFRSIPLNDYSEGREKILEQIVMQYKKLGYEIIEPENNDLNRGFVNSITKQLVLTRFETEGEVDLSTGKGGDEVFKKFLPGEFLVHEDHGVGVFKGLYDQDGKLYLQIDYAGNDKLLIPITQADKVTRYISGSRPKLTKLNNGSWTRVKNLAKGDTDAIAQELVQLYAMRQLVNTDLDVKDFDAARISKFIKSFKHKDTEDQIVATEAMLEDLRSGVPMDRLIVGDVGFGKTEVALRAAYAVASMGGQVAFLAPTTILVEQHFNTIQERFPKNEFMIGKLSRMQSAKENQAVVEMLEAGEINIVVGTHALLQNNVKFKNLGLIVIDEEQKFGVDQKEKLKGKRLETNVLAMSATPIPRTMNMALSGIREMSVIATPPPGRSPVINKFAHFDWDLVKEALDREFERDGQAYFLHNRVNSIAGMKRRLNELYPDKRVEIAHGQMSPIHLRKTMVDFVNKKIDVLVSTTIIENGLDLHNANTLIVNDANFLGLSQLYQIRGRVGRSTTQAFAYFLYKRIEGIAEKRLNALEEASDIGAGFLLANRDMEIRGAGNLLGKKQSGVIESVGYGLYMKMIAEKIEQLRSVRRHVK